MRRCSPGFRPHPTRATARVAPTAVFRFARFFRLPTASHTGRETRPLRTQPEPACHPERQRRIPYSVASMFCSRDSSSLRFALLAVKPFPGLFHDGPKSGAAAEIAVRLSLPPAAATRNSQNDRWTEKIAPTPLFWDVCRGGVSPPACRGFGFRPCPTRAGRPGPCTGK